MFFIPLFVSFYLLLYLIPSNFSSIQLYKITPFYVELWAFLLYK